MEAHASSVLVRRSALEGAIGLIDEQLPGSYGEDFDWLIRAWFKNRAAFTRPNLGTAISMSNTLAVATYSGGLMRILSIRARPTFRSFFSCARLTRMSFARLRASMRWSRDLAGAFA